MDLELTYLYLSFGVCFKTMHVVYRCMVCFVCRQWGAQKHTHMHTHARTQIHMERVESRELTIRADETDGANEERKRARESAK